MMIDLLFFTHLLNGLMMCAAPVLLGIYITRRFKLGWRLFWIGAATFVISQVFHIPFNTLVTQLFAKGILPSPPSSWAPVFNAVFLGLSAGIFEEGTRYIVYRWWATDARSWSRAVLMGTGHEGAEAGILGLLVLYTFFQMVALRGVDLATLFPPDQLALAQQQFTTYWSAPWGVTMLGAVERILALVMQISLSVLVLQVFIRRQTYWLALAILWHALADGFTVYFSSLWRGQPGAMFAIEGVVAIFALISLAIIFALRSPEPEAAPLPPKEPAAPIKMEQLKEEITAEKLDQSKFM